MKRDPATHKCVWCGCELFVIEHPEGRFSVNTPEGKIAWSCDEGHLCSQHCVDKYYKDIKKESAV